MTFSSHPADQRSFNFALTAPTLQDMAVHAELLKNRSLIEAVVKQARPRQEAGRCDHAKAAENPITAGLNQISVWIPWTSGPSADVQKPQPDESRLNSAVTRSQAGLTVQVCRTRTSS